MALQPINKLKEAFKPQATPTDRNFGDLIDSVWHKSEKMPQTQVLGLNDEIKRIDNTKATKDDVKNVISGLRPMGSVETEAELRAIIAPNDNDSYYVNETVDENGDPYIWRFDKNIGEHGNWVNTMQVVYKNVATKIDLQAKADIEKENGSKVIYSNVSGITNKLTDVAWTNGFYLNQGNPVALAKSSYSDFIDVKPYDKLYLMSDVLYAPIGCVYDKDKNFIGNITHTFGDIKMPTNASYIRVNIQTSSIFNSYLLNEIDYNRFAGNKVLKVDSIANPADLFHLLPEIKKSENLIHKDLSFIKGFFIGSGGNLTANGGYCYSEVYQAVEPNTKYSSNLLVDVIFYSKDANNQPVFQKRLLDASATEFITEYNTAFIRYNIASNVELSTKYVYKSTVSAYYIETKSANIDSAKLVIANNLLIDAERKSGGFWRDDLVWQTSQIYNALTFPVKPNTGYTFNNPLTANNGWWLNRAGLFIATLGSTGKGVSPKNAFKAVLNVTDSELGTRFFKETEKYNAELIKAVVIPNIVEAETKPVDYQFDLSMRNDNTFVGAMNTIFDSFYAANPRIRLVTATHFTKDGRNLGVNGYLKNVVDTQLKLADYWGIPCLDLSSKCGWVKKTSANVVVNTIRPFFVDQLHPAADATGQSSIMLKNFFVDFLRPVFGSDWAGKRVAIAGTSITAGHGSSEKWAKHIDEAVLELGGVPVNYAVSGRTARLRKVDGTLIENSFMNTDNTKNYTVIVDAIASGTLDLVIVDHGINDHQLDNTDFEVEY